MRILVFSDSHGDLKLIKKIISEQNEVQNIIFCGDIEDDILRIKEMFPDKTYHIVRGNNDYNPQFPLQIITEIATKKIMITHGHTYNVKSSLSDLVFVAKQNEVDIVVFGHTHIPYSNYDDGLYVLNPGSCGFYKPSYATIDISYSGVFVNIVKT